MTYSPSDSIIADRIQRAPPSDELCGCTRVTNLVQRERKFDIVALFYTFSLGFVAGSDRSLQTFSERYVGIADCDELSYTLFHDWFESGFVVLPREILDGAAKNFDTRQEDLDGHLECFRDVPITDTAIASLYQNAADTYTATGDHQAELKLHLAESLSIGLPT